MNTSAIGIDWYSFTFVPLVGHKVNEMSSFEVVTSKMIEILGNELYESLFCYGSWNVANGRKPYAVATKRSEDNMTIYYGKQEHVLVELSGETCGELESNGLLLPLVLKTYERATRLDIAIDFEKNSTNVSELLACFGSQRTTARGFVESKSGKTAYIGSQKSDRYVRVYEYYEPHPRAGIPRIEFVTRKKNIPQIGAYIAAYGVAYATQMIMNSYDWKGISVENTNEKMPVTRVKRENQNTVSWLIRQAAPAFRRLVQDGTIENPQEFIMTYFMTDDREYKQERMF